MARRRGDNARDVPEEQYVDERPRASQRYARKKGGNEGIWIALGGALVVGLIIIMIVAGGSSGKVDVEEATAALREVFRACVENLPKKGAKLVDPVEVLREFNPKDIKNWRGLTPQLRQELSEQAFNTIRQIVVTDMELDNMSQVQTVLRAVKVDPRAHGVDISFHYRATEWRAFMAVRDNRWVILRLDPTTR